MCEFDPATWLRDVTLDSFVIRICVSRSPRPSRARIPCECLLSAVRPARLSRSAGARGGGARRADGRWAFDPMRSLRGAWRALGNLGSPWVGIEMFTNTLNYKTMSPQAWA